MRKAKAMNCRSAILKRINRQTVTTFLLACVFAFATVFGFKLSILDSLSFGWLTLCALVAAVALFYVLLHGIWALGDRFVEHEASDGRKAFQQPGSPWGDGLHHARYAGLGVVVIAACWIPTFLAGYPGFFAYDSGEETNGQSLMQWNQFAGGG